jgi:hypothetical protein
MRKTKEAIDLSLEELRKNRIDNFIQRLYFALYENYYGNNRIVVKNSTSSKGAGEFGVLCVNTLFTKEELEYIRKEPEIFGEFVRQGWHVTTRIDKDHEDFEEEDSHLFTEFTFTVEK